MQINPGFPPLSFDTVFRLPKVVLHDHLDGGLRPKTIIELAKECGYDQLPTNDPGELKKWFFSAASSGSLPKYLETFAHTCAVMQTAPALTRVAREAVVDLARDQVVYAELRFAPEQHLEAGLTLQEVVDAVTQGLKEGMEEARDFGALIEARLILCGMRHADRTAEIAQLTVDNYGKDSLVVGFDIAGAEDGFPPSKHAEAFRILRENFVPFTIHAGEAAGRESLEEAVREGTLRIGHGARMFEDFTAAINGIQTGPMSSYVRDRGIPLELCPTSNVQTGVVGDISDHPFPILQSMGFCCTVNTDNRLMSDTTMTMEMMELVEHFNYDLPHLYEITVAAMNNAFAPSEVRARIMNTQILHGFSELMSERSEEMRSSGLIYVDEDDDDYEFGDYGNFGDYDVNDVNELQEALGAGIQDLNFDIGMLEDLGINLKDLGFDLGDDEPGRGELGGGELGGGELGGGELGGGKPDKKKP